MNTAKICSPSAINHKNPFKMYKNSDNSQYGNKLHNFTRAIDSFFSGHQLKDIFQNDADHVVPPANIWEENNLLYIELAAPGLKKEDFQISLERDLLSISTSVPNPKPSESVKRYRKEFNYNSFQRSFRLDLKEFDPQQIAARYDNGVLTLSIPRRVEKPADSFKINVQ